ncbi:MAG: sigma-70 family RNA polymerase sigma factor [Puniceicoccaceae bacterium]
MDSISAKTALASGLDTPKVAVVAEDDALVEQVREGDLGAFDKLVRKYRERIYSTLYHLTSNREDAADLAQEAFIKAFRSIHKFRGQSNFYTWLYRIAVNTALSALRRKRTRKFFSFEEMDENASAELLSKVSSVSSGAERPLLLRELQEKLNEALHRLSPKHRVVIVLFEIEGMAHEEIASILGVSVGTVRSRLHYSKHHLRGMLQPYLREA